MNGDHASESRGNVMAVVTNEGRLRQQAARKVNGNVYRYHPTKNPLAQA
jgi:hypothetical protein